MDHQNVERAFADLNNKYERAKEVVAGFQLSENNLKQAVEALSNRYSSPLTELLVNIFYLLLTPGSLQKRTSMRIPRQRLRIILPRLGTYLQTGRR